MPLCLLHLSEIVLHPPVPAMLPNVSLSLVRPQIALRPCPYVLFRMQHCAIKNTMPWGCSRLLLQMQHLDFPACRLGKQTNWLQGDGSKIHRNSCSSHNLELRCCVTFRFQLLSSSKCFAAGWSRLQPLEIGKWRVLSLNSSEMSSLFQSFGPLSSTTHFGTLALKSW